jgi:hypothetical protein
LDDLAMTLLLIFVILSLNLSSALEETMLVPLCAVAGLPPTTADITELKSASTPIQRLRVVAFNCKIL